jgi:hypothetical protein
MFSGNVRALLEHILDKDNQLSLDPDDAIVGALLAGQSPPRRSLAVA